MSATNLFRRLMTRALRGKAIAPIRGRRNALRPRVEALEDRTTPAVHTWTGGAGGGDVSWGTAANWTGGAPANGEGGLIVLNFPSVAAGLKATVDNIAGLNADQI